MCFSDLVKSIILIWLCGHVWLWVWLSALSGFLYNNRRFFDWFNVWQKAGRRYCARIRQNFRAACGSSVWSHLISWPFFSLFVIWQLPVVLKLTMNIFILIHHQVYKKRTEPSHVQRHMNSCTEDIFKEDLLTARLRWSIQGRKSGRRSGSFPSITDVQQTYCVFGVCPICL